MPRHSQVQLEPRLRRLEHTRLDTGTTRLTQSLLNDPNPKSPANAEAAALYEEERSEYYRRVRQMIEKSLEEDDSDESEDKEIKK
jgi:hypothetical protein